MNCRHCKSKLKYKILDLGHAPPSNNYLCKNELDKPELHLPLSIYLCDECWLVQAIDYSLPKDLFKNNYAYLSSTSNTWLQHAANYVDKISKQLLLNSEKFVVEIASNDGYLLKNFINKKIPCLGIEPTHLSANISLRKGIPVFKKFFSADLAEKIIEKKKKADLIIGNNVYAHVPDINDFTKGLKILLEKNGLINLEFPHLLELLKKNQFDTIYHEHFSYLSLSVVQRIFKKYKLKIFDVEKIKTHGGSLRIYACHINNNKKIKSSVRKIINEELLYGLESVDGYKNFQRKTFLSKLKFTNFILKEVSKGKVIAGFGAAAKANTLINYTGINKEYIKFICDNSTAKINKYMPGSHIPILTREALKEYKPDWVIIFPWNISNEIIRQENYIKDWGGKFLVFMNGRLKIQ